MTAGNIFENKRSNDSAQAGLNGNIQGYLQRLIALTARAQGNLP
jgi:hypothetical protein